MSIAIKNGPWVPGLDVQAMAFGLPPVSDDSKKQIESMIKDEMDSILSESNEENLDSLLKTYLHEFDARFPLPRSSAFQDTLSAKHERDLAASVKVDKLDFDKYSDISLDNAKTEEDIDKLTDKLRLVMEYANSGVINAELMDKFKQESWQRYIASFQGYKQGLEKELDTLQRELQRLTKRKQEEITDLIAITTPFVEKRDQLFNSNISLLNELSKT